MPDSLIFLLNLNQSSTKLFKVKVFLIDVKAKKLTKSINAKYEINLILVYLMESIQVEFNLFATGVNIYDRFRY